jgi:hypothetical protein
MVDDREGYSPEYWRDKARHARQVADGLATEANRKQMLVMARNYESLANEAELEKGHAFTRSA